VEAERTPIRGIQNSLMVVELAAAEAAARIAPVLEPTALWPWITPLADLVP
jgi:hypothetical protein